MAKFKQVVVAGTFNCIHKGHEALFQTALHSGERVLIGLTSDAFAKRLKGKAKPYRERKAMVEEVLGEEKMKCEIVMIEDEIGIAGEVKELEGIIVSEETEGNAKKINEVRKGKGLPELEIIVIELVKDGKGLKLSCRRK